MNYAGLTTLRRTTLVTWQRFVPPESITNWNQTTLTCRLVSGSEVMFMEADQSKDPDFEKVRSLELGAYGVDEASEVSVDLHPALAGRLRYLPRGVKEADMIRRGLYTSNPKPESWLQELFIRVGITVALDMDWRHNRPRLSKPYRSITGRW